MVRRGAVRRAKLYYLRDRRGKSARIAERARARNAEVEADPAPAVVNALRHAGYDIRAIPATPERLMSAATAAATPT